VVKGGKSSPGNNKRIELQPPTCAFFVHSSFLFKFLFLLFDAYPSYALIYGMLGVIFLVKLSVWLKKKINKPCSHSWDVRHYFF